MNAIFQRYKVCFRNRQFVWSFVVSLLMLIASFIINFYAGQYATERASNPVTDLILSNVPVIDVDGVFVWGAIAFWAIIAVIILLEPKHIPFTVKSVALFVVIRSVFVSITHIGPFPIVPEIDQSAIISYSKFVSELFYGKDLFFSGHTGLPFLMALIFWDNKVYRYSFIAAAILFGAVVLLAHLHYSIDVLGAFFITYSIYRMAEIFFKKDMAVFKRGVAAA